MKAQIQYNIATLFVIHEDAGCAADEEGNQHSWRRVFVFAIVFVFEICNSYRKLSLTLVVVVVVVVVV